MSVKKAAYVLLGLVFIAIAVGITYGFPLLFWDNLINLILGVIPIFLVVIGLMFLLVGWAYQAPARVSRHDIEMKMRHMKKETHPFSESKSYEPKEYEEKPMKTKTKTTNKSKKSKKTKKRKTKKKSSKRKKRKKK